jgi:hypothetical protein
MAITVTANDPKLTPIWEKDVETLPVDQDAYDRWVAFRQIPDGTHIVTRLGIQYPYTQGGAKAAIEESKSKGGKGIIYKACYAASTYDPGNGL